MTRQRSEDTRGMHQPGTGTGLGCENVQLCCMLPRAAAERLRAIGGSLAAGGRMVILEHLGIAEPTTEDAPTVRPDWAALMYEWRIGNGHTQTEAAALLVTSETNWARWERGDTRPTPNWAARIRALIGTAKPDLVLAAALREYRAAHALTQEEAADKKGVARRTWQAWELGERKPGPDEARVIWHWLDREMATMREYARR